MNAELIKALRYCAEHEGCDYYIAKDCPREDTWVCGADCEQILMLDAADALEAADKRTAESEKQIPKEGEWKKILQNGDGTSDYQCSACLGIIMDVPDDDEHPLCSFCPNCGAIMTKGERQ